MLYWRAKEAFEKQGKPTLVKLTWAIDALHRVEIPGIEEKGPQLAMKIKSILSQYLVATKEERKKGQPPRSELERVAQTQLRALKKVY